MQSNIILNSVSETIFTDILLHVDTLKCQQEISQEQTLPIQTSDQQNQPLTQVNNEFLRNQIVTKITTLRTQRIDECVFNALCSLLEGHREGYASLKAVSRATGLKRCTVINAIKRLVLQGRLKKYTDSSPEKGWLTNFFSICEK